VELSEGGRVRRLANSSGDTIDERLEAFDNPARSYGWPCLRGRKPE
jgi:hypothetical protein